MSEIINHAENLNHWINQAKYHNAAGKAVFEKSRLAFKKSRRMEGLSSSERFELIGSPEMWMNFSGALLYGYAIEILIKSLIIKEGKNNFMVEDKKIKFPWGNIAHDLVRLGGNQSLINFDERERVLLKKLTRIIVWAGRYPIPKKIDRLSNTLESDFEKEYDKLYTKLLNKLIE